MNRKLLARTITLYAAGLAIYGLLALPRLGWRTPNEFVALAEAWMHGRLDLAANLAPYLDLAEYGGRYFVPYPPAPALLFLPAVALFGRSVPHALLHLGLSAAILPLFYLVVRSYTQDTGHDEREQLWLVALLALGTSITPLTTNSNVYFTGQVVAVLFACLALLAAYQGRHPGVAGLALGGAFLSRGAVLLAAPLLLVVIWQGRSQNRQGDRQSPWPALLRFGLGLGVVLLLAGLYNWARFGNPLELGYRYLGWRDDPDILRWGMFNYVYLERNLHAAFTSLPVFLPQFPYIAFNPEGLSLLLTTPVLVLLLWLRRWTFTARAALLSSGLIFLPALFYANTGFAQYGYRYAADFLPFLVLAMALAGLRISTWRVKALILAGIVVCLWGAFLAGWYPFTPQLFEAIQAHTLLRYR
jgi:hypothetical protein